MTPSQLDEKSVLISQGRSDSDKDHDATPRKRWNRKKSTGSTIFSAKSLSELETATNKKVVEVVSCTALGYAIQMVLFFMLCLVIGLTPFFTQLLLRDPITGKKSTSFIPQFPYLLCFVMTVCFSNILSLVLYGTRGIKACWHLKSILQLSPISLLYGTSQSLETVAMLYLDSALRTILNQFKLPLSAVVSRIVEGKRQNLLQWSIILATTTAVFGFIVASLKEQSASLIQNAAGKGVIIGCIAVSASFAAQVTTDIKTKQMNEHLIIQMAQMRSTTSLVVLAYTIAWGIWQNELYKLKFYGWTIYVFAFSCFIVLKDFLTVYVLKRLNNIWLGLATSCGLGVAYIVDILFLDKLFDLSCFMFILVVSILVVSWGAAKSTS